RRTLDRLYRALELAGDVPASAHVPDAVMAALEDDLNTPIAQAELSALAKAINQAETDADRARLGASLKAGGAILGVLQQKPADWFASGGAEVQSDVAAIEGLIAARNAARKSRNFAEADRLRGEATKLGVVLEDRPDGTTIWRRAS